MLAHTQALAYVSHLICIKKHVNQKREINSIQFNSIQNRCTPWTIHTSRWHC